MTPAIVLLEQQAIDHSVISYEHDANAASYGLEAADKMGVGADLIFKTLVVQTSDGKLAVGIVPVNKQLSLKGVAAALKAKKVIMADAKAVTRSTGYQLGGVSPLAQKQKLATVIDASAFEHKTIYVSAGKRGLEVALSPHDLSTACAALHADIASD